MENILVDVLVEYQGKKEKLNLRLKMPREPEQFLQNKEFTFQAPSQILRLQEMQYVL